MATLDDSPAMFSGESWTTWLAETNKTLSDDEVLQDQPIKDDVGSMKLRAEDKELYGSCPAQDEFFLSVCEKCGQVVKPQALLRHIEQRHGQRVSPRKSRHHHHSSRHAHRHSNRHRHSPSSSSTSSKADKSYRSRSTERSLSSVDGEQRGTRRSVPVVKVERLDTANDSSLLVSNAAQPHDKCKISLKEVYKDSLKAPESPHNDDVLAMRDVREQNTTLAPAADLLLHHEADLDLESQVAAANITVQLVNEPDSSAVVKVEKDTDSTYGSMHDTHSSSAVSATSDVVAQSSDESSKHIGDFSECDMHVAHETAGDLPVVALSDVTSTLLQCSSSSPQSEQTVDVTTTNLAPMNVAAVTSELADLPESSYERVPVVHLPDVTMQQVHSSAGDVMTACALGATAHERDEHELYSRASSGGYLHTQDEADSGMYSAVAADIPETFDALDSEELVAKFEKMENDLLKNNKARCYHRQPLTSDDNFDSIDQSLQEKIADDLQNLDSKAFQIDNRSSTPVLHIPDPPKGQQSSVSPLAQMLSQTEGSSPPRALPAAGHVGLVHSNGAPNSVLSSSPLLQSDGKSTSRPPSRSNSYTMSRPPSRQMALSSSCPATPIKIEPWTSFAPGASQSNTTLTFGSVQNFVIPNCDIKQEVVMAPSSASTTHNVATAVTTCSLFTPPAASAMSSSFFAQPEMQVTIKPEVTTAVAATALPPTQQGFSLSVSSCGGDSVTQSSSITSLSASSSHSALYTSSISPTKKYTKDPKSIPCKDRIYDPEKHCGVWVADQQRNCTRSLTCKSHSLTMRRKVEGRSKSFDAILHDHKAEKDAMARAKAEAMSQQQQQQQPPPAQSPDTSGLMLSPPGKKLLASTASAASRPTSLQLKLTQQQQHQLAKTPHKAGVASPLLSVARTVTVTSSNAPIMSLASRCQQMTSLVVSNSHTSSIATATLASVKKQLPFSQQSRASMLPVRSPDRYLPLSSPLADQQRRATASCDDDDVMTALADDACSADDDMFMDSHPAPIAVNGWGARLYGSGFYAFNQRCDRLRNAFSSMLNSQTHNAPPPAKKLCLERQASVKSSKHQHHHSKSAFSSKSLTSRRLSHHVTAAANGDDDSGVARLKVSAAGGHNQLAQANFKASKFFTSNNLPVLTHKSKSAHAVLSTTSTPPPPSSSSSSLRSLSSASSSGVGKNSVKSSLSSVSVFGGSGGASSTVANSVLKTACSSSLKRKRSAGSGGAGNSSGVTSSVQCTPPLPAIAPQFNSPISISIPPNINLASLGIVVSNPQQLGSIVNGQFINLQGVSVAGDASSSANGATHLQIKPGGMDKAKIGAAATSGLHAKFVPTAALQNHKRPLTSSTSLMTLSSGHVASTAQPNMAQLTPVVNDATVVTSSVLNNNGCSVASGKYANHGMIQQNPSGMQLLKKESGLPNGVYTTHAQLGSVGGGAQQVKNLPISINHLPASAAVSGSSVNDLTHCANSFVHKQGRSSMTASSKQQQQQPLNILASKPPSYPLNRSSGSRPVLAPRPPTLQLSTQLAATLNRQMSGGGGAAGSGNRLLAPANLQTVYGAHSLSGALQLQGKHQHMTTAAAVTASLNKQQPLSLTIVAPGGFTGLALPTSQQQQQQSVAAAGRPAMLISNDVTAAKAHSVDVASEFAMATAAAAAGSVT